MSDSAGAPSDEPIIIGEALKRQNPNSVRATFNSPGMALNVCFVLTTASGCVSGYIGGSWGTVGACLSIITYFLFGLASAKSDRNTERFADSLYYQGFILTLFALLIAMTLDRKAITSDAIIQKFGLAIWTTFLGMSFRIATIQFRSTVSDQEEETQSSIAKYVAELNAEIDGAISELRKFKTGIVDSAADLAQTFNEQTKQSREETAEAIKLINKELPKMATKATERIDAAIKSVAQRIERLELPADALSARLDPVFSTFEKQAARLQESLRSGASEYSRVLGESVGVLERTRDDLSNLESALRSANSSINDAQSLTTASLQGARSQLETAEAAERGIQELGKRAQLMANQLETLWTSLDKKVTTYGLQVEDASVAMRSTVDSVRTDSVAVAAALSEGAERITAAIREARRSDDDPK